MRQNQNAKRSRGRGRRSGNSGQHSFNRNTTFESNGPEGRLRGNAQQLFEKYTSLANDAQSSGERVLFEANSQFADHYYRIQQSILANAEQRRQNDERGQNGGQNAGQNSGQNKRGQNKAEAEQDAEKPTETSAESHEAKTDEAETSAETAEAEKPKAASDTDASDDDKAEVA